MKKLCEIFNHKLHKGDVGVEIEMEGHRFPDAVDARWHGTNDGSLRGENREYIFVKPLPVDKVKDAIVALKKNLKDAGTKVVFSFRTSVHVHVNVQELTYPQYLNFIYTYLLLEEPLMTFCGKERKGNRFCLRLQDAEGMMDVFNKLFRTEQGECLFNIPPNQVRYSALNVEATQKFGSLEFRGMRGNLDEEVISAWTDALVRLREFAKSVKDPTEVYDVYTKLDPQAFMIHVLGDLSPTFTYPKMIKDVQRSFSLSLDLPFAFGRRPKDEPVKETKAVMPKFAIPGFKARILPHKDFKYVELEPGVIKFILDKDLVEFADDAGVVEAKRLMKERMKKDGVGMYNVIHPMDLPAALIDQW